MSRSVRDQLLQLGLVDERKLAETKREERSSGRKARKQRKSGRGGQPAAEATTATASTRAQAAAALRQRADRDREAARKRRLKEERSALKAQIGQIIDKRREPRSKGEIPYNFVDGKKIKRIYVTRELVDGLSAGRLGVVRTGERYEVVRREVIERLKALDPNCVVSLHDMAADGPAEDDPYADKPIPDDLMW